MITIMNTKFQTASLVLLLASSLFLSNAAGAEPEAPKPAPEMQKYKAFLGEWTYDGEAKATPIGKAGKMSGKSSNRLILGGFVMESRWRDEVNPDVGVLDGMDLHSYDAKNKTYVVHYYDSMGGISSGTETVNGHTWTGSGSFTGPKGENVKARNKAVLSADGNTITGTWELSVDDGNTWLPWFALTSKKAHKQKD